MSVVIKEGSFCPACKAIVLADCRHSMEQIRSAVRPIEVSGPASMKEQEIAECLRLYLAEYPAFRWKPTGCPNSEVRQEQDRRILIEDRAKSALKGVA